MKKVLVIGSGPIVIGQAAEFDYAGSQACRALKSQGYYVILINSNPATIMTDKEMADRVYIEPITLEFVTDIIEKERPDGLLAGLGGQVGLNLAHQLAKHGILEKYSVKLLGTPLEAIEKAEDRDLFKETMQKIHEPIPESAICETVEDSLSFAKKIGYPVVVRPAYTLGGTGGGFAHSEEELREIAMIGLQASPINQVLIEKSLFGWKEIEFEVMRDAFNHCITICAMENLDPVGIHTGDSIVVAPCQTLTDETVQMLRNAAIKIIRELKICGGCNVQFALDKFSQKYYVIEVNPRVSRSSALASKATGYPIAKMTALLALNLSLAQILNPITQKTALLEPSIDYCVLKMPRFPFDKFLLASRKLGTQMKATGEIMAIGRNFVECLEKAFRSLDLPAVLTGKASDEECLEKIKTPTDQQIYFMLECLRRNLITPDDMAEVTQIDAWFCWKLQEFLDKQARGSEKHQVFYNMVDTCAGEFEAKTNYFYSTQFGQANLHPKPKVTGKTKVIVLGSGSIRIGQGVEFDYGCVHCVETLRRLNYEAIMINCNPETVSTDYDISDKLYFEPLTIRDVLDICEQEKENLAGVICQFGGQTAINLAQGLAENGIPILGSSYETIDQAEDRGLFDAILNQTNIPRPKGIQAFSVRQALDKAKEIEYPVMVRPSFVLGGRGMQIVYDEPSLEKYLTLAVDITPAHPVLIDKYLQGTEVEVDAICDGQDCFIPGIMEHIERAGVHSGDSMAVYPSQTLSTRIKHKIVEYTKKLNQALHVKGLMNVQYVVKDDKVFVIEVNPRSSRTVPFLSKVTNIDMVDVATKISMGETLKSLGFKSELLPEKPYIAIKAPVFSFAKLQEVDIILGPEMKSTGEVLGADVHYERALFKAMTAAGMTISPDKTKKILITVADLDKPEAMELAKGFVDCGYQIIATRGTAEALHSIHIDCEIAGKIHQKSADIIEKIRNREISLVINTQASTHQSQTDGFKIRRATVEHGIPCLSCLDTAWQVLRVLEFLEHKSMIKTFALQDLEKIEE